MERLEERWVLSSAPLVNLDPTPIYEGDTVTASFTFDDDVVTGGGELPGLDPDDYESEPGDLDGVRPFDSNAYVGITSIVVNTSLAVPEMVVTYALGAATDVFYGATESRSGPIEPEDPQFPGYGFADSTFEIAVFAFDSFTLGAALTLTAAGSRPLALLSQSDLIVEGTIDVGANGATAGAGGGNGGSSTNPYSGDAAAGGPIVIDTFDNNPIPEDPANGFGRNLIGENGGGGGGFGGRGGTGSDGPSFAANGGASYGDLHVAIQGGSGGAAGRAPSLLVVTRGGGGGGGVELGASGDIIISGSILADGDDGLTTGNTGGGGGSGGGILVHADTVDIDAGALLSARGGDGGGLFDTLPGGGGGGGGRILLAYADSIANDGSIDVSGGASVSNFSMAGVAGEFLEEEVAGSVVPETYSFTINWGDGSAETTGSSVGGQIVLTPPSGDSVTGSFSATHVYDDDDVYDITVTVTDSGTPTDPAISDFPTTVLNVDPTADAGGPYFTFEDGTVTVIGSGTDAAGALDPLSFAWDLDDDGAFDDATGASATFDPAALGIVGTQIVTIKVKVTDGDGGEAIDSATVQVVGEGTVAIGGVLYVVGDVAGNDIVLITQSGSDIEVIATFNNSNPVVFAAADVNEIHVRTRGGHDVVVTASNVVETMTIDGGAGNDLLVGGGGANRILGGTGHDTLIGGSGDDVLVGGDGADMLYGEDGRDVLIGSHDSDYIHGGTGEDILIGGFTVYDEDVEALDAIMAIWGSSATYDSRVATLTESGGLLEAGATVFDDDDDDHIIGGAGLDLAFADTSRNFDGVRDTISLSSAQDTLVALN